MFYSHVKDFKMTTHPVYVYICMYIYTDIHTHAYLQYIYINARTYTIHLCIIVTPKRYRKIILIHQFNAILRSYLFDGYYVELQFSLKQIPLPGPMATEILRGFPPGGIFRLVRPDFVGLPWGSSEVVAFEPRKMYET